MTSTFTINTLFDFNCSQSLQGWQIVNDGVMGGLSTSSMSWKEAGIAEFSGRVSLENNGGFASVRTSPQDFKLSGYHGVILRVKGDGKAYKFRIRTNTNFDGVAYSSDFVAPKNEWEEIRLPFSVFKPTFRGRTLANVPPIVPAEIRQLGILISEKQEGNFKMELDWLGVY